MPDLTNDDWQADQDLDSLTQAKKIQADPARMARAKSRAEQKRDELTEQIKHLPDRPKRAFDGAVRRG